MENASKALIMAGSVLLGLLILGLLVMMFNNIRDLRNTEATAEDVKALAEYNRQIEIYNRDKVYGVELISLANLISDYNEKQADLKGYNRIELTIEINPIANPKVLDKTVYNNDDDVATNILRNFEKLTEKVNSTKNETYTVNGKKKITVQKLYGMRAEEIDNFLEENNVTDTEKAKEEISKLVDEYSSYKSELTQFKNTPFKQPEVEYDKNTGRIVSMIYKQK